MKYAELKIPLTITLIYPSEMNEGGAVKVKMTKTEEITIDGDVPEEIARLAFECHVHAREGVFALFSEMLEDEARESAKRN